MNSLVDHEHIYAARKADLSDWILNNHPEDVIREGSKSLRLVADPSVNIGMGFSGYKDFSTGEKGNPIDFLMNYYDYDFMEAVGELSNTHFSCPSPSLSATRLSPSVEKKKGFHLPDPVNGLYRQLYAYLTETRCIPEWIVRKLIHEKAIYQERQHNNIVFCSHQNDFAEVHGTLSTVSFHGVVAGSNPEGFFWFKNCDQYSGTERAYICEAAIDAMSLYAIHQYKLAEAKKEGDAKYLAENEVPTLYASIAGVANYGKVDSIRNGFGSRPVYLAVDNDEAGDSLRNRYPDMPVIIPDNKDWNEDLVSNSAGF